MPETVPDTLLWIDLETTGLDPELDPILEIAWIISNGSLTDFFHQGSAIVQPESETVVSDGVEKPYWLHRIDTGPAVVKEMHIKNGLIGQLTHPNAGSYVRTPWEIAEKIIADLINITPNLSTVWLAGAGVAAFDRHVLLAQMPWLANAISYKTFDISQIRRALKVAGRDDLLGEEADDNHRALSDIWNAYEQGKRYVAALRSIPATVTESTPVIDPDQLSLFEDSE